MSTVAGRLAVVTSTGPLGTQWLREVGPLSDVECSWSRQGGCDEASFVLSAALRWGRGEMAALRRERLLTIMDGPIPLWSGTIKNSKRLDSGVRVEAWGLGPQASRFPSASASLNTPNTATASGVPSSVNAAVDAAISRGWAVTRAADFTGSVLPQTIEPLSDLLDRASTALGQAWAVDDRRQLVLVPAATTATVTARLVDRPVDTTSPEYLTDLVGVYLDAGAAGAVRQMSVTSGRRPYVGRTVDLTELGQIPATTSSGTQRSARDILAGALGKVAPLPPSLTGTIDIPDGALFTMFGTPRSPSRLRNGRLRIYGAGPAVAGDLGLNAVVETDIDRVEWTATTDSVRITPVAGVDRSVSGILQAIAGGDLSTLGRFS